MSEPPGPKPLSVSLERLMTAMEAPPVDAVAAVFSRWSEIVGPDLAEHCRPVSVAGEALTISADDPVWASELRWLEAELLERLAAVAGPGRFQTVAVRVRKN